MSERAWLTSCLLVTDTGGAVAVEFALVSGVFLFTLIGALLIAYLAYLDQALDRTAAVAARQIMIGAVQKSGMGQDSFRQTVVCPALPVGLNCADLTINVQVVTKAAQPSGYYTLVNSDQSAVLTAGYTGPSPQFATGSQGAYMYVQLVYPVTFLPTFLVKLLDAQASYKGANAFLITASAAFRNEQY